MNDLATALATASQHTSRDCSQPQKTCLATTSQLTPRYYVSTGRRPLASAAVIDDRAKAPCGHKAAVTSQHPPVVGNFRPLPGTGAGSFARDLPEIGFRHEDDDA